MTKRRRLLRTVETILALVCILFVAVSYAQTTNTVEQPEDKATADDPIDCKNDEPQADKPKNVQPELRTWTSKKGTKLSASFVKVLGNKAKLRTSAGKLMAVPILKLCEADQAFVQEQAEDPNLIARLTAFAAGKAYFVWREDDDPLDLKAKAFATDEQLVIRVLQNSAKKPLSFAVRAIFFAKKNGKTIAVSATTIPKDTKSARLTVGVRSPSDMDDLKSPMVKVFLIKKLDQGKSKAFPMSNVLDVPVRF